MLKRVSISVLIVLSLMSFPIAAFATDPLPEVETIDASSIATTSAILNGTTTREGVTSYGFDFGTTTDYGQQVAFSGPIVASGTSLNFGSEGSDAGEFNNQRALAVDETGDIFVADYGNYRIQRFDSAGNYETSWNTFGLELTPFNSIEDLTVDHLGNVYVVDSGNYKVIKFDSDGNVLLEFGSPGVGPGQLTGAGGIAVDESGSIYVAKSGDGKIQIFSSSGEYVSEFSVNEPDETYNGGADDIAIDSGGNFYVTDINDFRVKKYNSSHSFVRALGIPGVGPYGGGGATSFGTGDGQFWCPSGIVASNPNKIFVSDDCNNRVQEFDSNGDFVSKFSVTSPRAIAVDEANDLFVSKANHTVEKFPMNEDAYFEATFINLTCNTQYHFRAFASNETDTAYGDDKTFTTGACPQAIGLPTGTATARTATISWDTVDGANNFRVAHKIHDTSDWIMNNTQSTTLRIVGLTPETQYDFRVIYEDQNGDFSTWSEPLQLTTGAQQSYEISNCEQLQSIAINPISKQLGDIEGDYTLTQNIDCSESASWEWEPVPFSGGTETSEVKGFYPIMDYASLQDQIPIGFTGTFNGGGYTISNLYQESNFMSGLFGMLEGALVQNLTIDNLEVVLDGEVLYGAGLSMLSQGPSRVENVSVNGTIATAPRTGVIEPISNLPEAIAIDNQDNTYIYHYGAPLVSPRYLVTKANSLGEQVNQFAPQGSDEGMIGDSGDSIAVDSSGVVYVSDSSKNTISKFDGDGNYLDSIGNTGSNNGEFNLPKGIAIDNQDNLYVVDNGNRRIQKFDSNGDYVAQFGSDGSGDGQFSYPDKIAVGSDGSIYVSDSSLTRIQKFDSSGIYVTQVGSYGTGEGQFNTIGGLAVDSAGRVFVSDTYHSRVQVFDANGIYLDQIQMDEGEAEPTGIAFDSSENINILNKRKNNIEVFDANFELVKSYGSGPTSVYAGAIVGAAGMFNENEAINDPSTQLSIVNSSSGVSINISNDAKQFSGVAIGGILGVGTAFISQSKAVGDIYVDTQIASSSIYTGGLAAMIGGGITDSYSTSDISVMGDFDTAAVGGLAAHASATLIERSYASGEIVADGDIPNQMLGGLSAMVTFESHSDNPDGHIINSFSAVEIQYLQTNGSSEPPNFPPGSITAGAFPVNVSTLSGNFFDETRSQVDQCVGFGQDSQGNLTFPTGSMCSGVNSQNSEPEYFFGNSTNEPFETWDFEDVWQTNVGAYPTLGIEPSEGADLDPDPDPELDNSPDPGPDPNLPPDPGNGNASPNDPPPDPNLGVQGTTASKRNVRTPSLPVPVNKKSIASPAGKIDSGKVEGLARALGSLRERINTDDDDDSSNKKSTTAVASGGTKSSSPTFIFALMSLVLTSGAGATIWFLRKKKAAQLLTAMAQSQPYEPTKYVWQNIGKEHGRGSGTDHDDDSLSDWSPRL